MIFITADDVAALTGFASGAAFLMARMRLERDEGFPAPMPTCRRPLKWRRDAVEAWVVLQGQPEQAAPAQLPPNVVSLMEHARSA